ncbi:hypothetical protein SAMN05192574_112122 [Mucilaginibacter gossypiicola]|uniref:Uncharacterized protein n=1 Tax=Mucilaginibacter gossypiicola TaxID=551995 RepID=A0A1H8SE30_9SPHI|nr:hypothetical protein SAMN05192574_112122 [Mucilaginibacter gossypiicola]
MIFSNKWFAAKLFLKTTDFLIFMVKLLPEDEQSQNLKSTFCNYLS